MIDGYKIISGTFLTNSIINGYYPTSRCCLESLGKADYVDEVIVAEGQSIDDTVNSHRDINKVRFIHAPLWSIDSFSYKNTADQYASLFKYCSDQNEKIVLTINWCDTILLDPYRNEYKTAVSDLVRSDSNFMLLPGGSKVLCRTLKTCEYGTPTSFYTLSSYRFDPGHGWTEIVDFEKKLIGVDAPKIFRHNWKTTYYTYEMLTFTRKNFEDKIRRHCEWDHSWSVDRMIDEKILKKSRSIGTVKMKESDHPQDIKNLLSTLTEDHYGFSCFGHVR